MAKSTSDVRVSILARAGNGQQEFFAVAPRYLTEHLAVTENRGAIVLRTQRDDWRITHRHTGLGTGGPITKTLKSAREEADRMERLAAEIAPDALAFSDEHELDHERRIQLFHVMRGA